MPSRRFALALLYLTATFVGGSHAHAVDNRADAGLSACFHEVGPHAESRGSNAFAHEKHECPACQFRAQHAAIALVAYIPSRPDLSTCRDVDGDARPRRVNPAPAARGPPARTFA
ncbi:MAG: hypothetical protein KGM43_08345 [Planctomycetota bacterium]|nr:hypothetical protein [Planctomycetota bacterium]